MSKIIHKIEEKIKNKMEGGLHLKKKEEEQPKHDDQNKQRGVKEIMHKIKNKMGHRRRGKKGRQSKGRGNESKEHKEGDKENEEENKEEESESESDSGSSGGSD